MSAGTDRKNSLLFKDSPAWKHPPVHGESLLVIASLEVFKSIVISSEEKERALRMRSEEAKNRFLAGRRLLRGIYAEWSGIASEEVPVRIDSNGKPYHELQGLPSFSMTHSGDLVVLLVSHGEAGVDLERERPLDSVSLARRYFSEEEARLLGYSPDPALFFRLWTCREAAIKADGRGMAFLLSGMTSLENEGVFRVRSGEREWEAFPWSLSGGYHGAVAFAETPRVILWCDLR